MESTKRIHIIIPTHNRVELLRRTLDSVASCELPNNFGEVFVVENGSEVAEGLTRSFEGKLPIRYIATPIPNKSSALNLVLNEIADDDFIIFLDDDVRVEKNLIQEYKKVFEEWGAGHYFGGPTAVDYEIAPKPHIKKLLPVSARGFQKPYQTPQVTESLTFLGFNWACSKADLAAIGGFDPNKGPGSPTGSRGQESDAQRRLFSSGCKPVYVPNALVHHYIPKSFLEEHWILNRAFQNGVQHGLDGRIEKFGLQQYLKFWILSILDKFSFIIPKKTSIWVRHRLHYLRGLSKGLSTDIKTA